MWKYVVHCCKSDGFVIKVNTTTTRQWFVTTLTHPFPNIFYNKIVTLSHKKYNKLFHAKIIRLAGTTLHVRRNSSINSLIRPLKKAPGQLYLTKRRDYRRTIKLDRIVIHRSALIVTLYVRITSFVKSTVYRSLLAYSKLALIPGFRLGRIEQRDVHLKKELYHLVNLQHYDLGCIHNIPISVDKSWKSWHDQHKRKLFPILIVPQILIWLKYYFVLVRILRANPACGLSMLFEYNLRYFCKDSFEKLSKQKSDAFLRGPFYIWCLHLDIKA